MNYLWSTTNLILKQESVSLSIVVKRGVGGDHVVQGLLEHLLLLLEIELLDSARETMMILTSDPGDTGDHVL